MDLDRKQKSALTILAALVIGMGSMWIVLRDTGNGTRENTRLADGGKKVRPTAVEPEDPKNRQPNIRKVDEPTEKRVRARPPRSDHTKKGRRPGLRRTPKKRVDKRPSACLPIVPDWLAEIRRGESPVSSVPGVRIG